MIATEKVRTLYLENEWNRTPDKLTKGHSSLVTCDRLYPVTLAVSVRVSLYTLYILHWSLSLVAPLPCLSVAAVKRSLEKDLYLVIWMIL